MGPTLVMNYLQSWLLNPTVGRVIIVVIGLIIVMVVVQFLKRSVARYVRDADTRYRARKFVTFVGYILSVLIVATIFSDRLGGVAVALGVAGAGIAFALQEVIASVAGWLAISFAGFYRPGDRVELGGIKGDVIDISVLRTTLMELGEWVKGDLYSGRIVRIANSFVFKAPVFNYSGDFAFLWDELTIPVKYGCDHRLAREILERVTGEVIGDYAKEAEVAWKQMVLKFLIEDATVAPTVTLAANDNWIEFTLRYVVDYKARRSTKDMLFTRILDEVEKTEGKVQLASTTFELVAAPSLSIKVQRESGSDSPAQS